MRKYDLKGKKFNLLTVLEESKKENKKSKQLKWRCRCDCGNERLVTSTHLISGYVRSCGCDNFSKSHGNRKTTSADTSLNALLNRHIQTAKRKNREWSLSKEQFLKLVSSPCYYCKNLPSQSFNVYMDKNGVYNRRGSLEWMASATIYYNGIDRKDNSKGYTTSNSLPCCFICNRAKLTMEYNDFIKWIKRIKENEDLFYI